MNKTLQKSYAIGLTLILVALTAPLLLARQDEQPPPPIVQHMRHINQNLRTLRGQFDQSAMQAENLRLVEAIRSDVRAAEKLQPLKTPQIPAEQREAFLKNYRAELEEVVDTLDQLEGALKKNDTDTAKTLILKLNDIKREGHQRFKSPD